MVYSPVQVTASSKQPTLSDIWLWLTFDYNNVKPGGIYMVTEKSDTCSGYLTLD